MQTQKAQIQKKSKHIIKEHYKKTQKNNNITNNIEKKLNNYLRDKYNNIKFDKYNYVNLIKNIIETNISQDFKYKTNLCIINFYLDGYKSKYEIVNRKDIPNDTRALIIEIFFNKFISWIKQTNKNIKFNTSLFIWISDRFIWQTEKNNTYEIEKQIPICLYSCPENLNYIIVPDNTFFVMSTHKRYAHKGLDWELQKKLFIDDIDLDKKENKIFFRGADTTTNNHNLRRIIFNNLMIEKDKKFKDAMIYEFLTNSNYESIEKTAKYKFQLNLPGNYPWSTRLKYLYLAKCFIINVRVKTIGDLEIPDEFYYSFIDIIIPQSYTFNIDMKYKYFNYNKYSNEESFLKIKQSYHNFNKKECDKVYSKIKEIYYKYKDKQPMNNINVNKSYKLINSINNNTFFNYYLSILKNNYKLGIEPIKFI